MNITEIETELQTLADEPFDATTFVFRLLEIYDAPKATVTKLKQTYTGADLVWKNKLFFRVVPEGAAETAMDSMLNDPLTKKQKPRFVFATDGIEGCCRDNTADREISGPLAKLGDNFLFFLPLANIEQYEAPEENQADVKATTRIARLYDAILEANSDWIERDYTHDLNQFMTRLLFCFFAEDTSIFDKDSFTSTVVTYTNEDGTDAHLVLQRMFEAMNTKPEHREGLPDYAKKFPYVNGGLFRDKTQVPKFSKRARRLLKECGELFWKEINPDIFGSMIQAVAQPGLREDIGMHYTSVPNILKVLQPLFLLSLEEEFLSARDSESKLRKLLQRIYAIRVFDPACGSGNFLIIAYKELRKLEMRIFERQKEIARQWSLPMTGVRLSQFFGIELTDFGAETAKLSLWIAEYQMNELFKSTFGSAPPALPLKEGGHIRAANAATTDWLDVCPANPEYETYVCGNPPYVWSNEQTSDQKAEVRACFEDKLKNTGTLNYVTLWLRKGADYCKVGMSRCAFVTINSVCQGEQAGLLWPVIFGLGIEIGFAHRSFKWKNLATKNAGVTCVIIGLRPKSSDRKVIYTDGISKAVSNIGPYLIEMDNMVVTKATKPLSKLPKMIYGNKPVDGGHLLLTPEEKAALLSKYPEISPLLKRFYGSQEVIYSAERWCLWIPDAQLKLALSIPPVKERIKGVKKMRLESTDASAEKMAERSHQFREMNLAKQHSIVVPAVSSEGREILPCAVLGEEDVVSNRCYQVLDPNLFVFSLIVSRLHYVWAETVGGKLEKRFNYSNTVLYNTFPVPDLSDAQTQLLEDHAWKILEEREAHPGKSIAWLYDPENMPKDLAEAHKELDRDLETLYIGRTFRNDTERLEHLFKLYVSRSKKRETKQRVKGAA